jgi:PAS domain S-box-containing protein
LFRQLIDNILSGESAIWRSSRSWLAAAVLFVALLLTVPLIGFAVYSLQHDHVRDGALADLRAIAALKAGQIEHWLASQRANAQVFAADSAFVDLVHASDAAVPLRQAQIVARLAAVRQAYGYSAVALFDPAGRPLNIVGDYSAAGSPALRQLLSRATDDAPTVQNSDLYLDERGQTRIDHLLPLFWRDQPAGKPRLLALVLLQSYASQFIFPLIQSWPTPSASAETLLVRRDGDAVLFLNELRHRQGTALKLRVPFGSTAIIGTASLLDTSLETFEGSDYRGAQILGAVQSVKGSGWRLVAKIDCAEIFAPLRSLAFWVSIVVLVAVALVTGLLSLLWLQQRRFRELERMARSVRHDRLLSLVFEQPFIGVAIATADGVWLQVNDRLCQMVGASREEFLSEPWMQRILPEDRARHLAFFHRLVSGKVELLELELYLRRNDGTTIRANISAKSVRNEAGRVDMIVAMVEDVTERRWIEQALQTSERKYRALVEQGADAVLIADLHGQVFEINHAGEKLLGYGRGELPGLNIKDLHPGDEWPRVSEVFNSLVAGGDCDYLDGRALTRRGETVPVDVRGTALEIDGRRVVQEIFHDLSAQKARESQRFAEEAKHRDALVREVHHRIKNNLQGVTGLLRGLATRHPELLPALDEVVAQVRTIAIVHGIYGRATGAAVTLSDLVHDIVRSTESLWQTSFTFDDETRCARCIIAEGEAVPLALVLNELMANTAKHRRLGALPSVAIVCSVEKRTATLRLANPGRLPADFDFDARQGLGTGLSLVASLMPPGGARISWEQRENVVLTVLELASPVIVVEEEMEPVT